MRSRPSAARGDRAELRSAAPGPGAPWHHPGVKALPSLLDEALRDAAHGPLCVGFSGGMDSTVLLHALASQPAARARGLRAWHVHHGLHDDADRWAAHCEATCAVLDVPLALTRVEVDRHGGQGPEAAARQARHAAFRADMADGEILVFAHHRDDQAETFLLRAMRASGPDGLAAMREWRAFGPGHLWRPLLDVPRTTLEAYAAEHRLHWIDDPGNTDQSFDRNFLRQQVLPLLRERWPHAAAALARSATLCAEAGGLLDTGDREALATVLTHQARDQDGQQRDDASTVSRSRLRLLPPPRRARVLRRWIETLGLPPLPAAGIEQIESTLLDARSDASACFEWHGAVIHAWRDLLHADWLRAPLPTDWQAHWDGVAPLSLPGRGTLSLQVTAGAACDAKVDGLAGFDRSLLVHARRGGERIRLPGRDHGHSLKQALQDHAVPPWERAGLPLLSTVDGELLAAGDRIHSAGFHDWLQAHRANLHWSRVPAERSID